MKKIILPILSGIFISTITFGQTIIPKIGYTHSTWGATNYVTQLNNSFSSQYGFSFGVAYSVPLKGLGIGMLSLQPEVSFVQKGFKVDAQGELLDIENNAFFLTSHQEYTIHYLEFPLMTKYEFGNDRFKFSISAGPSIAFGLGGKYKAVSTIFDGNVTTELANTTGDIKFFKSKDNQSVSFDHNIDAGIQFGIGAVLYNRIALDVRYGNSFTNTNEYNDSKNRVLQFTIGVPISLKD
ncbi:MAG: PorT family protein [Bacteroidetes bacterium]|nr:PorT family protein [Bacteroidota bacterium]